MIRWSNKLIVGHVEIDEDHRLLIDAMSDFNSRVALDSNVDQTLEIFDEICGFLKCHFENEERLQAEIDYVHRIEHAKEHQNILGQLHELRASFHKNSERIGKLCPLEMAPVTVEFLSNWLGRHILEDDMKMRGCFDNARILEFGRSA